MAYSYPNTGGTTNPPASYNPNDPSNWNTGAPTSGGTAYTGGSPTFNEGGYLPPNGNTGVTGTGGTGVQIDPNAPQRQTSDPNAPGYDPGVTGYSGAGGFSQTGANPWAVTGNASDPATMSQWFKQQLTAAGKGASDSDVAMWVKDAQNVGGIGTGEYWYNRINGLDGGGSGGSGSVGGSAPGGGLYTPSQYYAPPGGISVDGLNDTGSKSNDLYSMLLNRAGQSLNVNPNDPIIKNQVNAYGAQNQRDMRNYLASVAEKQGPSGNITAETRSANEKVAQGTSGFQAQLMGQELSARRNEIQQSLTQMGAFLTDQQRMGLQAKLASIDAALRTQGLNEQASEFGAGLGERAYEFDTNRNDNLFGA